MEQQLPTEIAVAPAAVGVVLRVKRRRDSHAPHHIVLEATSRTTALAIDLERSLGVGAAAAERADEATAAAPPKKRCRFVLLEAAAAQQGQRQQQADAAVACCIQPAQGALAAVAPLPPGCTRVLDLWHTSGLAQAATSSISSISAAASNGQHSRHEQRDHAATSSHTQHRQHQQHMSVYEEMVQQYLQQQPPDTAVATAPKPHIPPGRRVHRQHAADEHQPPQHQQQQQQGLVLPEYMTREMLQQYGLLNKTPKYMQPQGAATPPATVDSGAAAAAAAAAAVVPAPSATLDNEQEYVYDMYVPMLDEEMQPVELCEGQAAAGGPMPPIVQVWEEDMQDFDDLWTAGLGAVGDDDSEDSNAEGYFANSYPDEDDSYQDGGDDDDSYNGGGGGGGGADSDGSYGSLEEEECYSRGGGWGLGGSNGMALSHTAAAAANFTVTNAAGCTGSGVVDVNGRGLITCYQRHSRPHQQHFGVREEQESDEEYEAEGIAIVGEQEQQQQQQQQGLVAGVAWRAVLAEQFAPGKQREM